MTTALADPTTPRRPPDGPEDPFRIGYRYAHTVHPDGTKTSVKVPLTEEDFLHPQEEDRFMVSLEHTATIQRLMYLIDYGQRAKATTGTFGELRIDWQVPGILPHGPDVIAFDRFPDGVPPNTGTLRVADLGLTCEAIFEITSEETRHVDLGPKMDEYLAVGVPFYFVVDFANPVGDARLLCFRHAGDRYRLLTEVHDRGYRVPNLGLWFRLDDRTMMASDENGQDIPMPRELGDRLDDAQARAASEAARAASEKARAEEALKRAAAEQARADAEKARADALASAAALVGAEKARADAATQRAEALARELAELKARLASNS